MRITNSYNSFNNISSLFNVLQQGKMMEFANKLSNSKFLFPENTAPGKGTMNTDTVSYISDLKEASKGLSDALKDLSGAAFNKQGITSSDSDVMSVKYSGSTGSLGNFADMSVRVDQIATGQVNEGEAMKAKSAYSGDKGVNRFSIEMGGKTTQLSVSIASTDTNKDVQDKMAKAINDAGLGLKATVDTDSKTGTSTLRVEQQNTGSDSKNYFTIKDVTGNAVANTRAGNITSVGQDAIYSVNGGAQQTSKTNTVDLGNGVSATFKMASDEAVTISKGKDTTAAINAVKDMVSSYNDLFGAAVENKGDPKAQSLASKLLNITSVYSKSLSDVGIGFNSEGKLTIDSEKLNKAAENGSLEKLFTQDRGKNYGFTNQLERLASNVSNNTSAYVSNSVFNNQGNSVGYPGFGNISQLQALNAGSIFDYSF